MRKIKAREEFFFAMKISRVIFHFNESRFLRNESENVSQFNIFANIGQTLIENPSQLLRHDSILLSEKFKV